MAVHSPIKVMSCMLLFYRDVHREEKICALGSEVVDAWFKVGFVGGYLWYPILKPLSRCAVRLFDDIDMTALQAEYRGYPLHCMPQPWTATASVASCNPVLTHLRRTFCCIIIYIQGITKGPGSVRRVLTDDVDETVNC
jgi:hypothetical protein